MSQVILSPVHANGTWSIEVTGLHNVQAASGMYANSETLTYVVYAYDTTTTPPTVGDAITSGSGSLSYQAASDGNYFGTVSKDAELEAGTTYWLVISDATFGVVFETDVSTY